MICNEDKNIMGIIKDIRTAFVGYTSVANVRYARKIAKRNREDDAAIDFDLKMREVEALERIADELKR
jgi:hypothetical protein